MNDEEKRFLDSMVRGCDYAHKECDDLRRELEAMKAERDALQAKIDATPTMSDRQERVAVKLATAWGFQDAIADCAHLSAQVADVTADRDSLKLDLKERNRQCEVALSSEQRMRNDLEHERREAGRLRVERAKAWRRLDETQKELDAMTVGRNELKLERDALQAKLSDTERARDIARDQVAALGPVAMGASGWEKVVPDVASAPTPDAAPSGVVYACRLGWALADRQDYHELDQAMRSSVPQCMRSRPHLNQEALRWEFVLWSYEPFEVAGLLRVNGRPVRVGEYTREQFCPLQMMAPLPSQVAS